MAGSDYYSVPSHLNRSTLARLFRRITVADNGCWMWTGYVASRYGQTSFSGKHISVHRLMYAWLIAPLPRGIEMQLDHVVCDTPLCVNPAHVRLVSLWENIQRGNALPAINARKTHCKRGHELPPRTDAIGPRRCTTCRQEYGRNYAMLHRDERARWRRIYLMQHRDEINRRRREGRLAMKSLGDAG